VIGTLAIDVWAVTFGTARRGLGGLSTGQLNCCLLRMEEKREGPGRDVAPPSPLLTVLYVTAHHQRPMYQLHIIQCGTIIPSAL